MQSAREPFCTNSLKEENALEISCTPQMATKSNILLVGAGAVGTIAALSIETGGFGTVTAVLRSNYEAVMKSGFRIDSIDHGHLIGWRPTKGT